MYDVSDKKIQNFAIKNGHAGSALSIKQTKQIDKLFQYIAKMKIQIRRIQSDANIPTVEKQRKIARCLEIIQGYENDIRQESENIRAKNPYLYTTLMNRLEKQK